MIPQKERTHAAILDAACTILRERGIKGARVADVMKAAGLTVGGFYAHFTSKESLIDAAIHLSGAATRERLFDRVGREPAEERGGFLLDRYLTAAHRDDATTGCPFPAILGEVATNGVHCEAVAAELEAHTERLAGELHGGSRRVVALGMLALMCGGLTMARAARGTPLSDEILRACRAFGRRALAT